MLVAAVYRGPEKVRTGVEARGIYVVVLGEVAHFVVLFISVPFFFSSSYSEDLGRRSSGLSIVNIRC